MQAEPILIGSGAMQELQNRVERVETRVVEVVREVVKEEGGASESQLAELKEYVDEKVAGAGGEGSNAALQQEVATALAAESSSLKQYVDRKITQALLTPSITGEPVDQTQILGIITKLMKDLITAQALVGIMDSVTITHDWDELRPFEHIRVRYDGDSNPEGYRYVQALIQLNNNYCRSRRCLECRVGYHMLKHT